MQAEEDTPTPRWVKVGGLIVAIVALLFLVTLLLGGGSGGHGPGRHFGSQDSDTSSIAASDEAGAHQPQEGGHR